MTSPTALQNSGPPASVAVNGVVGLSPGGVPERAAFVIDACGLGIAGLELPLRPEYVLEQHALVRERVFDLLRPYDRNTLHIIIDGDMDLERIYFAAFEKVLADFIQHLGPSLAGVTAHPDDVREISSLAALAGRGPFVALEIMGQDAPTGNTLSYFEETLRRFPELSLTLDTAHALETMADGGPGPLDYLERFGSHVRHFHVSRPGNFYPLELVGPDFYTRHSLLSLEPGNVALEFDLIFQALARAPLAVRTLEGVIPANPAGRDLLSLELDLLSRNFSEHLYNSAPEKPEIRDGRDQTLWKS